MLADLDLKKIKKRFLLGIMIYALEFFSGCVVLAIVGRELIGHVMIFLVPFLTLIPGHIYLKKYYGLKEGLVLGLTWMILIITLDFPIMVYFFDNGFAYFSYWTIWVGHIEMIMTTAILGIIYEKSYEKNSIDR